MSEVYRQFEIKPEILAGEKGPWKEQAFPGQIDVVITGSRTFSAQENQIHFGDYISGLVADAAVEAGENKHRLVLDAATGSSPRAAWKSLASRVENGLDLSGVVVIGHEEAWGPKAGSSTDFDFQRREMLRYFGEEPIEIHQIDDDASEGEISGNFVQMYGIGIGTDPVGDGRGEYGWLPNQNLAAKYSAEDYNKKVRSLLKRGDVRSIGVYGIGTDGHIGEWQIQDMGYRAALGKLDAFVQPQEHYSVEAGMYPPLFDGAPNLYWKRGMKRGQAYGRAEWQPDMNAQEVVVGLGLRDMLKLDQVVLAFNNESKSAAFQMAMEGSVNGALTEAEGGFQTGLRRNAGEGEGIWEDLASYGRYLESEGWLSHGTVDNIDNGNIRLKSGLLYKKIYDALDIVSASSAHGIYRDMGNFTRRYIGNRSPLGQFIRMRALLGRQTTIVATPEVVKDTRYEALVA